MSRIIVMTGGGTAGHVTPNLALIDMLQNTDCQIHYIGSKHGVEKDIVSEIQVPYYGVSSGKLRRYFSWQNISDPFKTLLGIAQSYTLLRRINPDVVFSKGGFVAFPVVVGAWLNRIPVVAHESDMSPGLANRLSYPFVNKICLTFEAGKKYFKTDKKIEVTGTPIRSSLLKGDRQKGLALCGFHEMKPCLLVVGGSQGSKNINRSIRETLSELTKEFQVIHLCGRGNIDETLLTYPDYIQIEFAKEELTDLLAASDLVISRSGANTLYELLVLKKPHILIPLPANMSRGDQIQNAAYFEAQGISKVINDQEISPERLLSAIKEVNQNKDQIIARINALGIESAVPKIIRLLEKY